MCDPELRPRHQRGLIMPASTEATAATAANARIIIDDYIIAESRDVPVTTACALVLRCAEGEDVELLSGLQHFLLNTLASIADDVEVTIGRMPEVLTSTVAALLGISRPTLMKWARAGEIASFAVGTHPRL